MQMQLNRDHVHVSNRGISIEFKKDQPTYVPKFLVADVTGLGATAVTEADKPLIDAEVKVVADAKAETEDRAPAIEAAIRKMLERNQRGDFTAGSKPNLNVLGRMTGLQVSADEMDPIWRRVSAEIKS